MCIWAEGCICRARAVCSWSVWLGRCMRVVSGNYYARGVLDCWSGERRIGASTCAKQSGILTVTQANELLTKGLAKHQRFKVLLSSTMTRAGPPLLGIAASCYHPSYRLKANRPGAQDPIWNSQHVGCAKAGHAPLVGDRHALLHPVHAYHTPIPHTRVCTHPATYSYSYSCESL